MMARFIIVLNLISAVAFAAPEASLSQRLKTEIQKRLPKGATVTLERLHVAEDVSPLSEIVSLKPEPPVGLVTFQMESKDGAPRFGNATVRATHAIAVVKRPIQHGEAFTDENVSFEKRELSTLMQTGYFFDAAQVKGLRAQGYIRPGTPVSGQNSRQKESVAQGQLVELVHFVGSLGVSARVKALQAGAVGDWITVENPDSHKRLQARVTGIGEVTTR